MGFSDPDDSVWGLLGYTLCLALYLPLLRFLHQGQLLGTAGITTLAVVLLIPLPIFVADLCNLLPRQLQGLVMHLTGGVWLIALGGMLFAGGLMVFTLAARAYQWIAGA